MAVPLFVLPILVSFSMLPKGIKDHNAVQAGIVAG